MEAITEAVRERYAKAADQVRQGRSGGCCETTKLYDYEQVRGIPEDAVRASLGCGNPTLLAPLNPGETVLDLGSGGGIDVLLSAKRVGPTGKAYGLDMTDEMLALARENQRKSGATNVEFLKGQIESIPLHDNAVDVIISNCVINLSADKGKVLQEAFRVLKPGGRFAVSDVVVTREIPDAMRADQKLWCECVSGALSEKEYRSFLAEAGFTNVTLEKTQEFTSDGTFISAFIRATKPAA